jgi:hypothetical protein
VKSFDGFLKFDGFFEIVWKIQKRVMLYMGGERESEGKFNEAWCNLRRLNIEKR